MRTKKPKHGIAVDAGMRGGNPGFTEYRGVMLFNNKSLFSFEIGHATNNIGEFIAIVHGIKYAWDREQKTPIWSDSQTALLWVKKKQCNTNLVDMPPRTKEIIRRAILFLNKLPFNPILHKWQTREWGEIPADYGRK